MTRKEALAELIEKVEEGGDVRPSTFKALRDPDNAAWAVKAFYGSLDAVKALHEAVLPGWEYGYNGSIVWVKWPGSRSSYVHDAMNGYTSRAWLLAILRALYAQEPDT